MSQHVTVHQYTVDLHPDTNLECWLLSQFIRFDFTRLKEAEWHLISNEETVCHGWTWSIATNHEDLLRVIRGIKLK